MQEEQMRTCIRCGERNRAHFNFCWKCGTDLSATSSQSAAPSRKRTNWLPFVLVPAILSGGYFVLHNADSWLPRSSVQTSEAPKGNDIVTRVLYPPKPVPVRPAPKPQTVSPPIQERPAAATFWPQERQWSEAAGWMVYETTHIGCFARKSFPGGLALVLGRMKETNDLIVGITGTSANLPPASDKTLSFEFDGTRKWQPYFEGHTNIVAGRYSTDTRLAEEIARSARLRIMRDSVQLVEMPLEGTRAAFAAIGDCVGAMAMRAAGNGQPRESALPRNRLCENKPLNGQLLTKRGSMKAGGHKITIRNSGEGDAIIKVRNEGSRKLAYSFLVHRNEEATIEGADDGEYRIQFAYGDLLIDGCTNYATPLPSQFDQSINLVSRVEKTKKGTVTHTRHITATLYAVRDGNAPTSQIDPATFLEE